MNADDPNVALVVQVAQALGPLRDELVFVGGCAIGLLVSDQARPPVRATNDVDLVAEVTSKADYYQLTKRLKERGFLEEGGDIICRWKHGNVVVDVMPTDESILGFSYRWYVEAVKQAEPVSLNEDLTIKLVSGPLLLATKIEAFYGRGNGDFGSSHDMEDILVLMDGRPEIVEEVRNADSAVRDYLKAELDDLLGNRAFLDAIPFHFGRADQERVPIVIERLRRIAGI